MRASPSTVRRMGPVAGAGTNPAEDADGIFYTCRCENHSPGRTERRERVRHDQQRSCPRTPSLSKGARDQRGRGTSEGEGPTRAKGERNPPAPARLLAERRSEGASAGDESGMQMRGCRIRRIIPPWLFCHVRYGHSSENSPAIKAQTIWREPVPGQSSI